MQKISNWILKCLGWKILGEFPPKIDKYVIAVAPHTSNWDFPLGILVRTARKASVVFIGKHTLFLFPYGFIFRWLGGYPVDRTKSTNYVDSVVKIFDSKEKFAIVISPEGTRKKVMHFKTGFYYIAKKANIPLILCKFDYVAKEVVFSDPIFTTDDFEGDMEQIYAYFRGVKGKNPSLGID
jgi:1-acyl-sn-glycerol-3-phosphate acyltransferase